MSEVSQMDKEFYLLAREHINQFCHRHVSECFSGKALLEIGPEHPGTYTPPYWDTLDIKPGCRYQGDITKRTPIQDSTYDTVLCLEVLEHCMQPFEAVAEIRRILKPNGLLLASTPLNFRIHGPANDCFRFTEHGVRVLMKDFDDLNFTILEAPDRFLFPINYAWTARCNKHKNVSDVETTFRWIT